MVGTPAPGQPSSAGLQYALPDLALGQGAAPGQPLVGPGSSADRGGLARALCPSGLSVGDLYRPATFPGHWLSGGQLDLLGADGRVGQGRQAPSAQSFAQAVVGLSAAAKLSPPAWRGGP